jgi:iron uptake system component EfeO
MSRPLPLLPVLALLVACTHTPEEQAVLDTRRIVDDGLQDLERAARDLRDAAPAPDADGWNAEDDADAVTAMRARWHDARVAYERIEGAIAVLFPELDASTDERYDGFLAEGPDDDLFDGEGVTGVHAVERILWAGEAPPEVVAFEEGLPGYVPAAFPADEDEARAFRDGLCQRLVDDVGAMREQLAPLALDAAAAYGGVVGSMQEQAEKVALEATGEAESRYAQHTLADMRANLAGGRDIFDAFAPWVVGAGGDAVEGAVQDGFDEVAAAYDALEGDDLPDVPADWDPDAPTEAQLATPYGQLWSLLRGATDPEAEGSLVHAMVEAADAIGVAVAP